MSVTIDEIGEFIAQPVPREVPVNISKTSRNNGAIGMIIFGSIFAAFGSIFLFIFFPFNIFSELSIDMGNPNTARGRVTYNKKTSISVGGSKHNSGTPVYEVGFEFTTNEKEEIITGKCYKTGNYYKPGNRITVEYVPGDPETSRIKGCSLDPAGYFGSFVIIFPLAGGLIAFFGIRSLLRKKNLLKNGIFASAEIKNIKRTNMRQNHQYYYKITVAFDVNGITTESTFKDCGKQAKTAREKHQSGEPIGILYNPEKPNQILIVDSLLN
jgi:hypothetical protein